MDPFRHHPDLKDLITPAEKSFFYNFDPTSLDEKMAQLGAPTDWRFDTKTREAYRHDEMQGRWDQDLWVFAYGSLCWDPALEFDEVRHAHLPNHARRFILKDTMGARGTVDNPGLMAALSDGSGCDGLAFKVPAAVVDAQTHNLWARERVSDAYQSTFLQADTAQGGIEVLAFVANPKAKVITPGITRADQVQYIARGHGILGSSLDYARKLQAGLKVIEIVDADLDALLAEAETLAAQ